MKAKQTGIFKHFKFSSSEQVYKHDFEIHVPLTKLHHVMATEEQQKNCVSITKADSFILNAKV